MVPEGTSAITPVPSTAGVTDQLNNGPYTFLVQAYNSSGLLYDSATITIKIQAGAINYGTYDTLNYKVVPSQVSSILLSTGADRTISGLFFVSYNFSQTVTFQNADNSKPGGLAYINCRSCNNWLISGVMFTGNLTAGTNYGGIIGFISSTNMFASNVTAYFSTSTQAGAAAFQLSGCVNCGVDDFYAFGVSTGVDDNGETYNANITISRFKLRQFSDNAFFIGNSVNMTISDCVTMAPMRTTGFHLGTCTLKPV
jgi:hypothetical protein